MAHGKTREMGHKQSVKAQKHAKAGPKTSAKKGKPWIREAARRKK